jgi:hypothetical protein
MERRVIYFTLSFAIALLLAATFSIVGCGQEQSPTVPDQETLLAPGNSKGVPATGIPPGLADKDGKKDKGNPEAEIDDAEESEIGGKGDNNGKAKGKDKPKSNNGKAKGKNKHKSNNGKARDKNKPEEITKNEPNEPTRHRGAVKEFLWDEVPSGDDDRPVGWVIARTTANDDDEMDGAEVALLEADGNILIVTIHLGSGPESAEGETFDIYVIVKDSDGVVIVGGAEPVGTLTTNHKGKGTGQVKVDLVITAQEYDEDYDWVSVEVFVKSSEKIYGADAFEVALKVPEIEEEL